ncbi:MAG: hypothetical protein AAF985_10145 [Bacteroidota bacterium]
MRVFLILVVGSLLFSLNVQANPTVLYSDLKVKNDTVPKVFLLGEYEAAFEQFSTIYPAMLLDVCNYDMQEAYGKWLDLLQQMEAHSEMVEYDLKAIKVWLNVFWNKDGSIDHIAYYLKPASKNIDTDRLTLFLISFINSYQPALNFERNYAHYGSAAFPTMPRRVGDKKKMNAKQPLKDSDGEGNGEK